MRKALRSLLPVSVRRMALRWLAVVRRPTVTVVMPMYNVEHYVGECLDSLLAQDFASMEVLVVDDGSTDGSAAVVRSVASRDRRVRLLTQSNQGQGPARNLAVRQARGEFLIFIDSDDLVPPGSVRVLVSALRQSGSDFAVGGVERVDGGDTYRPSWSVVVHEHDRTGITIDQFPAALADVVAHHRIFRRRFWVDRVGEFAPGVYEDHVPMVLAYLRARRFDLLRRVVYAWRLRADGTSTGQQKHDLGNLQTRIAVKAQARDLVWREGSPRVRAAWVGRVLDIDFPPYIEQALRADDTYRRTLSTALAAYVDLATPEVLPYVRVRQKIRTYLAARERWDDLRSAERVFDELGSIPPTNVRGAAVMLERTPFSGLSVEVPSQYFELGRSESRLQVCLSSCEVVEPDRLALTGWAVVRAVDLSARVPAIELFLVADGVSEPVSLEHVRLPEATEWVNWRHGSFDRAGFSAEVSLPLLARHGVDRSWRLRASVRIGALERDAGVHHALGGSSASRSGLAGRRWIVGNAAATLAFDREHGFTVDIGRAGPAAT